MFSCWMILPSGVSLSLHRLISPWWAKCPCCPWHPKGTQGAWRNHLGSWIWEHVTSDTFVVPVKSRDSQGHLRWFVWNPETSIAVGHGRDTGGSSKPHIFPLDAVGNELEPWRLCCCSLVVFPSSPNTSPSKLWHKFQLWGELLSGGDSVGIHLPPE